MKLKHPTAILLFSFMALAIASCSSNDIDSFKGQMQIARSATSKLYSYIWNKEEFYKSENHVVISELLDDLITTFQNKKVSKHFYNQEPGFKITLDVNNSLLKDVRTNFAVGNKDYALWKVKSLTSNCVSCHSRYKVPVDFSSHSAAENIKTLDEEISYAEFLFATHQYDDAASEFLRIAIKTRKSSTTRDLSIDALKNWLVIVVRVKQDYDSAYSSLNNFISTKEAKYTLSQRRTIKHWVKDLKTLSEKADENKSRLELAKSILAEPLQASTIEDQENLLVNSLHGTALLHSFMGQAVKDNKTPESKDSDNAEALLLLGKTYINTPLRIFDATREYYLEACIRQHSKTPQAKEAFAILKDHIELESTGSSGINLTPEDSKRLEELSKLINS